MMNMMEKEAPKSICPLCSLEFEGENCHSSCPTSAGCSMIRCPNCGFEFVEKSAVIDFMKSLFERVASRRTETTGIPDESEPGKE